MRKGITLVEMLIVIGIVAALSAVILPAMGRLREQSRSVQCLSNLRELGQAAFAYAQSADGFFPLSTDDKGFDWDLNSNTSPPTPGRLWLGATVLAVQQCPSYNRGSRFDHSPFLGYNYNTSYIGGGAGEVTPLGNSHASPERLETIHHAPRVALFGDGQYSAGADKFMRAPLLMAAVNIGDGANSLTRISGTQGYRHLGRTNVCYCDGHAESVADSFASAGTNTNGVIAYDRTAAAGTGFLSPDNSAYDGR